jgi:hypothetical protein
MRGCQRNRPVTEDAQMSVTTTASNIIAPTQVWAITDAY